MTPAESKNVFLLDYLSAPGATGPVLAACKSLDDAQWIASGQPHPDASRLLFAAAAGEFPMFYVGGLWFNYTECELV